MLKIECQRALKPYAQKTSDRKRSLTVTLAAALSLFISSSSICLPALSETANKITPSGTLLLPLTPKLDQGPDSAVPSAIAPLPPKAKTARKASSSSASAAREIMAPLGAIPPNDSNKAPLSPVPPAANAFALDGEISKEALVKKAQEELDPDEPDLAKLEEINDDSLLKGTVQIVADDTEYDQVKNTFLGTGNAIATIAGQDARLEADMILYDQASEMLDARGNVKIVREGQVSTGSSFKFKVSSDEYLITNPDTEVQGTTVIARTAYGTRDGLRFRQGTLEMPEPIYVSRNAFNGTIHSLTESFHKAVHTDAYMPEKASFVFKARKMVYEKYKETGNLTVFGGKLMFGKFGVPLGKFTATVGKESQVTFPITPLIGNNIMVGGLNVGPMFNTALPGDRVFSWAPLVQYGGRTTQAVQNNRGNIGAGFRLAYRDRKLNANLAYGSVSNLLVGDLNYRFNDRQLFQAGINRFIQNGLFGAQRARAIAELVDNRGVGNVPFLQGISLRSSAGLASDQPSLLNQTPEYRELFTIKNGNITNGFRLQEQLMTSSHPLFAIGNMRTGVSMNMFGGTAGRLYSTGDRMLMGQLGPVLNLNLDRLRLQGSMMKSGVNGQSPFVFDQFIQGSNSGQFGGSLKICKWLDIGGNLGANLDNKLFYQKQISAAIGPDDFKLLVSHDTIRGINRFGFDFMYGQPIPFNKLILKGSPDHGQLGGI